MKENEKFNELSDEQLDDVSGGTAGMDIQLFDNMDMAEYWDPYFSWTVIETGVGVDECGKKYTYEILYNTSTGERREERYYSSNNEI